MTDLALHMWPIDIAHISSFGSDVIKWRFCFKGHPAYEMSSRLLSRSCFWFTPPPPPRVLPHVEVT